MVAQVLKLLEIHKPPRTPVNPTNLAKRVSEDEGSPAEKNPRRRRNVGLRMFVNRVVTALQ
eukprot:4979533-Amphidinium_carterae.1